MIFLLNFTVSISTSVYGPLVKILFHSKVVFLSFVLSSWFVFSISISYVIDFMCLVISPIRRLI